ncbi:hypothetical protein DH2020_016641 [Rehmannia glutinosa]|uniref:J domain-containing protein n=1 Tax=Rehmannia glutinosa TaxID=99300 RepID=A0ABR0WR91_REHGL
MSPTVTPNPALGIPKPDCSSTQNLNFSESFDFSSGSTDGAGFNYSKTGTGKPNISSRSRPRLMKIRRKQVLPSQDKKFVKTDLGLNGFSDVSGEIKFDCKLGNAVGGNDGNSRSNGSANSGDLNGNAEQLGNGLEFGVNLNDSLFGLGLGNGKSLFGSSMKGSTSNLHLKEGDILFASSKNGSHLNVKKETGSFVFASDKGGSNLDVQKETGSFVFGARKAGSTADQSLPAEDSMSGPSKSGLPVDMNLESGQFVFGVDESESGWNSNFNAKDSRGFKTQPKVHAFQKSDNIEFVFGSDKNVSASRVTLNQQDRNKSTVDEFGKVNSAKFVFGASKNVSAANNSDSQKQDCGKNMGKSESNKDVGNTVPDVRGKVKMDTSGDSEKVCNPCLQFPFNLSDDSSKNHLNFVFGSNNNDSKIGIDLKNKPTVKNRDMSNSKDSCKDNAENGIQFQNACLTGVFVFGGLKGKGGLSSGESIKLVDEMNQLNRGKAEDCNGFGQQNNTPDINSKFQHSSSSGGSFEKDPAFSISNEMKRLNIGATEVDSKKTGKFTSNFSVNSNNVFMFGSDQKSPGFIKENHPINLSEKTPDASHLSDNNSESNKTDSSLFPSVGIGIQLNGGFCGVSSVNEDEKDSISFTSKLDGLNSSDADYSTPNMTFTFSNYNLFPGVDKKLDHANSKSLGGKRSKKKHGKLRQRTVVQQPFGQDRVSKENSSLQNQKSPGCGSPMDFSPYQDTSACSAPVADIGTGVKGEFAVNEKDTSEHCEKPHDEENNSNFSPSAQDGLSTVRRQYKKKYKLKVGSNHTVQGNNSDKENAKQDTVEIATHEVCEHWRLRGNQAYHAGKLSKAEEFYSMGINFGPHVSTPGYSIKPLLLCYSNRAATRMSLGRMREAIGDCTIAAELDPNFLKATLRAGNCYLVLGEVEEAIQCYSKCLSLGTDVCLDRRIIIEAADGLQKAKLEAAPAIYVVHIISSFLASHTVNLLATLASVIITHPVGQKLNPILRVAEYMHQSAKLLQEGTDDAASSALRNIEEALSISRFSERLLQMKGEALCSLRMYDEVIQLCEQTLDVAKKNFDAGHMDDVNCESSRLMFWRWHLQTKSHYHLGKLDLALDFIEKQEKMSISLRAGDVVQEPSIALAATIRELLCLKKSGNEAFNSGRYTEAIENYTAAISKSFESRPFMAICFCNRAAAYQSINQIVDAIADCSLAIALVENYHKAISRRATLHELIRDYKQAVYDLQRLISLLESQSQTKTQQFDSQSRSNGGSVRDLRKARRRLSLVEEKAKKEIPLDLYLILGIKASDAESEIKKAYRKAALRHHPDKVLVRSDVRDDGTLFKDFGDKIHKDSDRLFKIIGEAYAVLSDPSKRSKYDNEEEIRNIYRESNRNGNSGCPSTSYSSPYERGSSFGRQAGSSRYYWYESRSYSTSHSRW